MKRRTLWVLGVLLLPALVLAASSTNFIHDPGAFTAGGGETASFNFIVDGATGVMASGTASSEGYNGGGSFYFAVEDGEPDPTNSAPMANAGSDQVLSLPITVTLNGSVFDDGLPNPPGAVTTRWSVFTAPSDSLILNPDSLTTAVKVAMAGAYVFRLTADDSQLTHVDTVSITLSDSRDNDGDGTTNENDADDDNDGVADGSDTDIDGDGFSNDAELAAGTDPSDKTSAPPSTGNSGGGSGGGGGGCAMQSGPVSMASAIGTLLPGAILLILWSIIAIRRRRRVE